MKPYYSFMMLCYNNWHLTKQSITTLIESLSGNHKDKGIELIILNNGSSDVTQAGIEEVKKLHQHEIEIKPVHLPENMGYPVGVNMGLAHCMGEIVTILNNDLVFPEKWFDGIVSTLESDKSIGVAAPFLSIGSGREHVGVRFQTREEMKEFAANFMQTYKHRIIYTPRMIGACMSYKREVLSLIGGNDFWYGLGQFDDDDLSLRTAISGYKLAITGSSFVEHIGTVTFRQASHTLRASFRANRAKFIRKWCKNQFRINERLNIVQHAKYSRNEHFFPLKWEDFETFQKDSEMKPGSLLLAADWTNIHSQWRETLAEIREQVNSGQYHLYLFIPADYFSEADIVKEAEDIFGGKPPTLHYITESVPPVHLLQFIGKFQSFLPVKNDYINLYLKYLADRIPIDIFILGKTG